ncbi:MAG: D-aminoacyl-tRNA deacylase [Acidobacteriota bacterium]
MRLVVQRVASAEVEVEGRRVAAIERGFLVLLGAERGDGSATAEAAARKVAGLRVFEDDRGHMNLGLSDVGGAILAVSQFTLAADLSRGRRPGFEKALPGPDARPIYDHFCAALELAGFRVERGVFGEAMRVSLVNDGPATFVVDIPGASPAGS